MKKRKFAEPADAKRLRCAGLDLFYFAWGLPFGIDP